MTNENDDNMATFFAETLVDSINEFGAINAMGDKRTICLRARPDDCTPAAILRAAIEALTPLGWEIVEFLYFGHTADVGIEARPTDETFRAAKAAGKPVECCAMPDGTLPGCQAPATLAGHAPGQSADMMTFACDEHKDILMCEGYTWPIGEVL